MAVVALFVGLVALAAATTREPDPEASLQQVKAKRCQSARVGDIHAVDCRGPRGRRGRRGPRGFRGLTGPIGSIGPQGATGARGVQGLRGVQGAKGDPGNDGTDGAKGDKGDPCLPTDPACRGPQGDKGDPCLASDPNCKGPKGDKGDPGEAGPQGARGPAGPSPIVVSSFSSSTPVPLPAGGPEFYRLVTPTFVVPANVTRCLVTSTVQTQPPSTAPNDTVYLRNAVSRNGVNSEDDQYGTYLTNDGTTRKQPPVTRSSVLTVSPGQTVSFGVYFGGLGGTWFNASYAAATSYLCH